MHLRSRHRRHGAWQRTLQWVRNAAVCLVTGVCAWQAFLWVREQQYLVVKNVVVQGNQRVPVADILEMAAIPMGLALYRVQPELVARAVMRMPDLATCMVSRVPPDQITITVTEHEPVATVALGHGVYLVNREGEPFRRAVPSEALDLPVITGIARDAFSTDRSAAMALLRLALGGMDAHHAAGRPAAELAEVRVDAATGVSLMVGTPPAEVVLGHGDYPAKLKRLSVVEKHLKREKQSAAWVFLDDSRHPERVAVRFSETSVAVAAGAARP